MLGLRIWQRRVFKTLARLVPGHKLRRWLLRRCGYTIGQDVYIGEDLIICEILEDFTEKLVIGDRVAMAPRVMLVTSSDPNWSRLAQVVEPIRGRIVIEQDAWIGAGTIILPNVTIGEGAIVGSGSVVTRDVPPWTVTAGAPARVLRAGPRPAGVAEPAGPPPRIEPSAEVSLEAQIGAGTRIWHNVQIREGARLGQECIVGKNVYIDIDVVIGDRVKIQNNALLYHGATVEDGVFIGPAACLTNDRLPRAVTPEGALKLDADWQVGPIHVREGASIGARAVILPNVTIGEWAMVAAGAVVTHDVPPHGLVSGVPARLQGYVCRCGERLESAGDQATGQETDLQCPVCGRACVISDA
jgi:acetyltransferase-like isoleucine patch superfamily enzyme